MNTKQSLPTLGVVAICYNEERDLPGFLRNLLPWVDEIVLVDDGSTDRTKQLALEAGDKVKFLELPRQEGEYYSHQRNKGIDHASSDWLLHMDIDERVPKELTTEILDAIQDSTKDGYRYRRLNYFLHRPFPYGGWQRWNLIHLARREVFKFGGKMHETCLLDAPEERVGQLNEFMHHFNDESFAERLRKNIGYSMVEAETMLERGKRIRWYHLVARPSYRFLKTLLYERAIFAGVPGIIFSIQTFCGVFNWFACAWDLQNRIDRDQLEKEFEQ